MQLSDADNVIVPKICLVDEFKKAEEFIIYEIDGTKIEFGAHSGNISKVHFAYYFKRICFSIWVSATVFALVAASLHWIAIWLLLAIPIAWPCYFLVFFYVTPEYVRVTQSSGVTSFEFRNLMYAISFKNLNKNKVTWTSYPRPNDRTGDA